MSYKQVFIAIPVIAAVLFSYAALAANAPPPRAKSGPVIADFSEPKDEEDDGTVQLEDLPPDRPVAEFVEGTPQSSRKYFYEKPTMKALSHLYFAINYADVDNDLHIDNYLRINECSLFRRFISSEFEMKEIREATRKFINSNRSQFPTRFELTQEIKLLDYDMERRAFKIDPQYQIQAIRRFELFTTDGFNKQKCGASVKELDGFPFGIILEVSRPFTFTYVPVDVNTALAYIDEKNKIFQKFSEKKKNKANMFELRKAYITIYAKVFAFRKLVPSMQSGYLLLQTLAVMEGFDVYADPGGKTLFYSKSFLDSSNPKEVSEKLLVEYKQLREKIKGEGMLH
ncbi:MAG: DUF4852 domain-containing protein [Alphaproteobacteria bacterium]|nr:DUF4852 domain-containing protein [Alphaproteobacteria bacterium]